MLPDKYDQVIGVERVTVHFKQTAFLTAEIVIKVDEELSVRASKELAVTLQTAIKKDIDVIQVDIHLNLSPADLKIKAPLPPITILPPFNQRDQPEIKFAGI